MFLSIVPFLYSKRTAAARSLVSLIEKRTFCGRYERTTRRTTLPNMPWIFFNQAQAGPFYDAEITIPPPIQQDQIKQQRLTRPNNKRKGKKTGDAYARHPGVLDVRGRSDFSRFDPRPERPRFSNFLVRPRSEDLFLWSEDLFVRRRLRSDFRRFDLASPGDGPTLATLVRPRQGTDFSKFLLAAWIEDLFADGRPSVRGGRGGRAAL
jgi:hypothetical protein